MTITKDNVDKKIGTKLRLRRTTLGFSQGAMAEAVGVTFQQIQKYEKGTNSLNTHRLCQFAKLLEVPISYFFEEIDELKAEKPAEIVTLRKNAQPSNRESLEVMKAFNQLKEPTVRKRVADLVRAIANDS